MQIRSPARRRPRCEQTAFCATQTEPCTISVARSTLIGATATVASQLVATPLDVVSKSAAGAQPLRAAAALLRSGGPTALFRGLPMHVLKRAPTKALTVCLFETLRGGRHTLTRTQHIRTAMFSGALSMAITYPVNVFYYAFRKGVSFSSVVGRARLNPASVLYAGFFPAMLAVVPAVCLDYTIYNSARTRLEASQPQQSRPPVAAVLAAAAMANIAAGTFAEPLKMVARRTAVAAVKGNSGAASVLIARSLLAKGPGEFWRGFPKRSVRYAATAVVSKTMVQRLRAADRARAQKRNGMLANQ